MSKSYLTIAAAALAMTFAACSSDDLALNNDQQKAPQLEEGAVGFDVYTKKATTRGGVIGSVNTTDLKDNAKDMGKAGFGVFGYYTDNNDYDQRSVPNFFYNQQVTWEASAWTYSPVKYWPNEYGSNAKSEDADRVTYFAYAPWVEVVPTSGKLAGADAETVKALEQWGITGMTRNSNQGDPILKYIASFDTKYSVDLCWGVVDNNDGQWTTVQSGVVQNIENGTPWLNVERPASTDQRVKFTFKHALAQMKVKIDADVNVNGRGHGNAVDGKTRVWVREVKFNGFAMKGSLNLDNDEPNKPKWLDYNGQNELVAEAVTVYDGRKDGKEGVNGSVATNEKTIGLNPILVQDEIYTNGGDVYSNTALTNKAGVTNADPAVNLFNDTDGTLDGIFHVIPTDEDFEIEIVYDIETVSENLAQNLSDGQTKGSSIENRIQKKIFFGDAANTKLLPGHSYVLNLHLGMASVKFDAAVVDWIDEPAQDVDLPLNTPIWAANATGSGDGSVTKPYEITIPYTGDYTFALTGLNGGETVASTAKADATYNDATNSIENDAANFTSVWTATSTNALTNGYAIQTLTTKVNNTTSNRKQTWSWKGAQSTYDTYFTFTQQAHPLELTILGTTIAGQNKIYLGRSDKIEGEYGWFCKGLADDCEVLDNNSGANYIKVWRNGVLLTWDDNTPAGKTYNFGDTSGQITIADNLQKGDVIVVELKTGDAPAETASFTVQ